MNSPQRINVCLYLVASSIATQSAIFGCSKANAADHAHHAPWNRHTIDDSSRGADGVRLADMNGDGRLDIATGWEEGGITRVYRNPGPTKVREPWPAVTVGKSPNVEDAVWFDVDGDGRLDIVSSCEGKTRQHFVHCDKSDGDQ